MRVARWLLTAVAVVALMGCVALQGPRLALGQTEAELVAQLGPPTGRYAMPDGVQRLEWATGPLGRQTWMVDIGRDGRSLWFDQVLNSAHLADFAARAPGMDVPQLLRELGRPAERRHGGWAGGEVWSWRYPTNDCLWWQVSIGRDGKVISAGHGIDPLCDVNDRATLF